MLTPTPSPNLLPPPGPTGLGPLFFLLILLAAGAFLWWRVRVELRRKPREDEDDVA